MTKSILDLVGNTPLIEIKHPKSDKVRLYAKCEWANPTGSVKDRAAKKMMLEAIKNGDLENKILIDATSGNTGIAYALFGAAIGIEVELALPQNASTERKCLLQNAGAKIHFTSAMEATDGAQRFVEQQLQTYPDRYFCPDQYNNDANWQAHFESTGPEIYDQTKQSVTHFVAGLGTTGSFTGTSRFLQKKGVTCIEVQPDNPMHGLEGWKHMQTAIVPGIYDPDLADQKITIATERSYQYAKAANQYLGLPLSPSAAANLAASLKVIESMDKGFVVTLFPDNAMKYLKDPFWTDHDYTIKNPFI